VVVGGEREGMTVCHHTRIRLVTMRIEP